VKAILFDFGGTIDTDGVHWSEMFRECYRRHHVRVEKEAFDRAFVASESALLKEPGIAAMDFRRLLDLQFTLQLGLLGVSAGGELAGRLAGECYAEVAGTVAGARDLLAAFGKRYVLGLVSNFYGNLVPVCRGLGLDGLFGTMVDSAVEGVRKPDPAIFALALERLGVQAAEAWVVGDSYDRDIVPGKLLGCSTIWLKGKSWTTPADTAAADYTITSLGAMRSIVLP
jgi:FMN phosphatase YigB (HAD superfamily)